MSETVTTRVDDDPPDGDPEPACQGRGGNNKRERITAYHEAAHAVVNYRRAGHAGGRVSVRPDPEKGVLGVAEDVLSDSFNSEHMEARILSCYAGGHAQREVAPEVADAGCEGDEEIAADLLRSWGWELREQELRHRSRVLTRVHWAEIAAVAEELLRQGELDDTEIEIVADGAAGDATASAGLAQYRALRAYGRSTGQHSYGPPE